MVEDNGGARGRTVVSSGYQDVSVVQPRQIAHGILRHPIARLSNQNGPSERGNAQPGPPLIAMECDMVEPNIDSMIQSATRSDGLVYFVQAGKQKAIKIGWTQDLRVRFSVLQTGNIAPLRIRLALFGSEKLEKALHRRFVTDHRRGEWFWFGDEIKGFIASHKERHVPKEEYAAPVDPMEDEVRAMLEATEADQSAALGWTPAPQFTRKSA